MSTAVQGAVESGPVQLHRASFEVDDFAPPTGREEDWRFTPLDRLRGLLDEPDGPGDGLNFMAGVPEGVELTSIGVDDPLRRQVPKPVDRVGALAMAAGGGAIVIRVPADARPEGPVSMQWTGEGGHLARAHTIIDIGAHAEVDVLLEHHGSARYAGEVSVLVGDGARLNLAVLNLWDDDAVHLGHVGFRLGRDATVRSTQVSLGGDLVRVVETVEFAGPGGDVELAGLYIADAGQHIEHRLFVDHAAPNCKSNVVYKGALQGDGAHTVWVGDVLIEATAEGTETYELNRNLVLSDGGARRLGAEPGDRDRRDRRRGPCSATGRFDDEQLFYLQARGIPEDEARRLVVHGFFADLVNRIGIPDVRDRLMTAIETELKLDPNTPDTEVLNGE